MKKSTNKPINIKKIAELTGVSVATVSRVINKNGRYSKETEKRVLDVIRKSHYVPNMSAKGLRTSKTNVIGIVVPDITNPFFSTFVLNLQMNLFDKGYSCLICNSNESSSLEEDQIQSLISQNVDGIIIMSGTQAYSSLSSIPTIYVDRPVLDERPNCVSIESDNELGGYLATKELLDQGCKEIALLMWDSPISLSNQKTRYKGFQKAIKENKKKVKTTKIVADSTNIFDGEKAVSQYLKKNKLPDGIVGLTDTLAIGACFALNAIGKTVPDDIRITGYDNSYLAQTYRPAITSVHQDTIKMAELAVENLLDLIDNKKLKTHHIKIPVELIQRGSTRKESYSSNK